MTSTNISNTTNFKIPYGLIVAIIAALIILFLPPMDGLPIAGQRMLAILVFAVIVWISEALSYEVSSFVIMGLMAFLLGTAPSIKTPEKLLGTSDGLKMALVGFSNTALLLVAVALFIAAAMTITRLDRRIALVTLTKLGASPYRVLLAAMLITIVLSFIVPSATARVACVVPIMMGAIAAFGIDKRSNLAGGIMILIAQATSVWNVGIMTSAAQNLLTTGFMKDLLKESVTWSDWLVAGLPWSILMSIIVFIVILWVMPPEQIKIEGGAETLKKELADLGPMSTKEKCLLWTMVVLLFVWATEGKLHSFDTASTTLVGLSILMLPQIGVMTWKEVQTRIPWGTVVVFGVGISLGAAIVSTHAGVWLADMLIKYTHLTDLSPLKIFAILSLFLIVIHIGFASATALTSAMLPVLISVLLSINQAGGSINPLGMTMLLGFVMSFGFLLPINAPQNMVCIGTETFTSKQFTKTGIWLTLIGYGLLLLFAVTWWPWLGWL